VTILFTASALLAGAARPPQADRPHLAAAEDAAKWIRSTAIATPAGTTWPADPNISGSVSPALYSGSSGVVLFMLELRRATGRPEYLEEARKGADHLLTEVRPNMPPGLYTGLAGIGFTLNEVAKATHEPKYREGALRVVDVLKTKAVEAGAGVEWNDTTDIISGSSGIGLFLLYAAKELESTEARELATRAGRRLIELGQREAGGLKWAMSRGTPRLMPNFSHGTAGIAYFLATLYQATGDRGFLDAARSGARYIQAVAKTDGDVCLVFHHEPEEDGRNLYYLGWCHGPAGTARLWFRMWQATGDRAWLEWMKKSARGIATSGIPAHATPGFWNNVGQCCGSAGVAEFFLEMHRVTKDREYLAFSRQMTDHLLAKATRDHKGLRWVQAETRVRPEVLAAQTGWMQGAAGIGAWLLRLDAFDQGGRAAITLPDSPF